MKVKNSTMNTNSLSKTRQICLSLEILYCKCCENTRGKTTWLRIWAMNRLSNSKQSSKKPTRIETENKDETGDPCHRATKIIRKIIFWRCSFSIANSNKEKTRILKGKGVAISWMSKWRKTSLRYSKIKLDRVQDLVSFLQLWQTTMASQNLRLWRKFRAAQLEIPRSG